MSVHVAANLMYHAQTLDLHFVQTAPGLQCPLRLDDQCYVLCTSLGASASSGSPVSGLMGRSGMLQAGTLKSLY